MRWLKTVLLLGLVVVVFFIAVFTANQQAIALKFAIWETPAISSFWWLLAAFVLGLGVGLSYSLWLTAKHRLEARSMRQALARAEGESLSAGQGQADTLPA
ncbi:MAG: LapA family protein [Pseudomonadota bacterium]